jgi:hypothetical protein
MRFSFLLLFLGFLLVSNCSSNEDTSQPISDISISLADTAETFVLKDELTSLGIISGIDFLDENRLIISDISPGVYLFENFEMIASYGGSGKGPCEFEVVSAFDTFENTLYVLDHTLTKIIYFDIETQECIDEITHKDILGVSLLHREENSPSFILGNTPYGGNSRDSLALAYRLFDNKTSEALDFTLGRIKAVNSMISLRGSFVNFEKFNNSLYGYYPMTDSLYTINLDDYSVNSIPLKLDIQRDEIEAASDNVSKIIELIRFDFELLELLFITNKWIGIQVNQKARGEDVRIFRFFTHDGDFIKEMPSNGKVIAFHKGRFVELYKGQNPNSEYIYSIGFRALTDE